THPFSTLAVPPPTPYRSCILTACPHAPQRPRTRAPQLPRSSAPNPHRSPRCRNCPSACRGELLIGIAAFTVARGSICLVRALLALELVDGELGFVGEQLLGVARVVALPVEVLLPRGHARGHEGSHCHVDGSAAHVQQRVDRQ